MKTSRLISVFIYFLFQGICIAQIDTSSLHKDSVYIKKIEPPLETFKITTKKKDTMNILKIRLEVMLNEQVLRGANINVYEHNELDDVRNDTSKHVYDFIFKRNSYYSIQISKPGLVTRIIAIDTRLPKDFVFEHLFEHEIIVSLFGELNPVQGLDTYYLDFPIGIIAYDDDQDEWMYRKKYSRYIKKQVNKAREYSEEKSNGKK